MNRPKYKKRKGLTLLELMMAVLIMSIVSVGVAVVLVNCQRAYQVTYDKVYSDVVTDAFVARRLFDSIVRKSSTTGISIDPDGDWVQLKYYSDDSATYLDRYAKFFTSGLDLRVEYGSIDTDGAQQTLNIDTICDNVSHCVFKRDGNSVRMVLELDNDEKTNVLVTSAFMHN